MNIHTILVHFPIALLSLYTLMELIRWRQISELHSWFYIKLFLVVIGSGFSVLAYLSGHFAEQIIGETPLIQMHENFAKITIIIYGLIALFYLIKWLEKDRLVYFMSGSFLKKTWLILLHAEELYTYGWIQVIIALLGLTALSITGALGIAIAYNPNVNPVVKFVYSLFFSL